MATKKKPAKKIKKVANGHNKTKNGHNRLVEEAETLRVFPAQPDPDKERFRAIDTRLHAEASEGPQIKHILRDLAEEVATFRDTMVEKYTDYYGHDLRRNVAWFMEQYGLGILGDMERVKAKERQKLIAENRAIEEAAAAAKQTAEK